MPRPKKWRKICTVPKCRTFSPDSCEHSSAIQVTLDEYEAIRLIDFLGMTQEECSEQMEISRATVQGIYASARKKLAECIVGGRPLTIAGGEYQCCEHRADTCGDRCCRRRCGGLTEQSEESKETNRMGEVKHE